MLNNSSAGAVPRHESPLVGIRDRLGPYAAGHPDFALQEEPLKTISIFRASPSDPDLLSRAASALGVDLPGRSNTCARASGTLALWLGPDEWMIVSDHDAAQLEAQVRQALNGGCFSFVDVSGGYTTLRLAGAHASLSLARGCPLDLQPDAFPAGACAQSLYFKAPLIIAAEGPDRYSLVVRRSFAEYFVLMLLDALEPIEQQRLEH